MSDRRRRLLDVQQGRLRIGYDGKQPAGGATAGLAGAPQPGSPLIVERGANGTAPADHPPGALVTLVELEPCPGDCDTDRRVSVNELIVGGNIALGRSDLATCTSIDANAKGTVAVNELIVAVNRALNGRPGRRSLLAAAQVEPSQG